MGRRTILCQVLLHSNHNRNLSGLKHLLFSLTSLGFGWGLDDLGWAQLGLAPGCRLAMGLLQGPQAEPNSYGDMLFSWWMIEVDEAATNFSAHWKPLLASSLFTFISQSSRYEGWKTCPLSSVETFYKGHGWTLYYQGRGKTWEQYHNFLVEQKKSLDKDSELGKN